MLDLVDRQFRDTARSGSLVGLGGAGAVACSDDNVGIAPADLVEMCPGRGGRFGRCKVFGDARRLRSGEALGIRSTLASIRSSDGKREDYI